MGGSDVTLVLVGDTAVGKTALFTTYETGTFPSESSRSVPFYSEVLVDDKLARICYWDTLGSKECDRVRPFYLKVTDVCFLCFSVDNRDSFENIPKRWFPELHRHSPESPVIIIGCKSDLRKSRPNDCIPPHEIKSETAEWRLPYYETSALEQTGLSAPFEECVRLHREHVRSQKPCSCTSGLFQKLKPRNKSKPRPSEGVMPPDGV